MAPCDFADRQVAVTEMRANVGHDRSQPCGGDAPSLGNRPAIARGPGGRGDEIMYVGDRDPLQLRGCERQSMGDSARIADEQGQCLSAVRNEMDQRVVEPPRSIATGSRGTRMPMKRTGVGRMMVISVTSRAAKNASPSRSIRSRSR